MTDRTANNAGTRAVVLLSGGLDSATTLALARHAGHACHTLALDYGQRHRSELQAAARIANDLGAASHRAIRIDLGAIGGSALTDSTIEVPDAGGTGIPPTYVPARNTLLLSLGLGLAEVVDAECLYIGVNAVDYSGYPDCRPAFIAAFQELARCATRQAVEGAAIRLETPLIHLSKAEIISRGTQLGVDYSRTVSCYRADAKGRACGRCDSCVIRREGFARAGIEDPTRYCH